MNIQLHTAAVVCLGAARGGNMGVVGLATMIAGLRVENSWARYDRDPLCMPFPAEMKSLVCSTDMTNKLYKIRTVCHQK